MSDDISVEEPRIITRRPRPPDEADVALKALRQLHQEGAVAIKIDDKRLRHIDSPVVCEADSVRWLYGFVALAALAWYALGIYYAVGVAAVGAIVYPTLVRLLVHRKLEQRIENVALADISTWRKLWRFGGVALIANGQESPSCEAPQDNWMAFVNGLGGAGTEQPAE
jgi:hypothetical protein